MGQRSNFPRIIDELERNGRKVSCWAWWVFPTDQPGMCEPGRPTFVTRNTAHFLFSDDAPTQDWRRVLEKLCKLMEESGMDVIPRRDHGRVHFFIKFYKGLPDVPDWMTAVLKRFDRYQWPSR